MKRLLNILHRNEWSGPRENLPEHVIECDDSHPFFAGFDQQTHRLDWSVVPPVLVEIPAEEIAQLNAEIARAQFKQSRAILVDAITVEVNGNLFDGNEVAQARMLSAIAAAQNLGSASVPLWVLADNQPVYDLPVEDLKQAHALAVVAMASVWLPS